MLALEGILVVSIEQAVAAPFCTARLCDAGARVIKIERETGDFARDYDCVAGGDSSYFAWTNLGKESLALNFKNEADGRLLHKILSKADIFVQNLAPGALERSGIGSKQLRQKYPDLITCDITGYGDNKEVQTMKAYDFLVQAESGLISISGGGSEPGRVGISICDISAGMNAHAGILEALIERDKTGRGSGIEVSLFGAAADWMTVPLLHHDYGGKAPGRTGLHHPSIAPYGGYRTADGETVIIAVQNEREWTRFCAQVLNSSRLASDNRFNSNDNRVKNRPALDSIILSVSASLTKNQFIDALSGADIAYGSVNGIKDLSQHPALLRRPGLSSKGMPIDFPAHPIRTKDAPAHKGAGRLKVPAIGEHNDAIQKEFE